MRQAFVISDRNFRKKKRIIHKVLLAIAKKKLYNKTIPRNGGIAVTERQRKKNVRIVSTVLAVIVVLGIIATSLASLFYAA